MDLNRRRLLKNAVVLGGGLVLGHFFLKEKSYTYRGWLSSVQAKSQELLEGIPFEIEIQEAKLFVQDYMKYTGHNAGFVVTERLKKQFLLSTNVVSVIMKKTKRIQYVLYYDPYVHPCYNPFTHYYNSLSNP
jgi:hypothetical protein